MAGGVEAPNGWHSDLSGPEETVQAAAHSMMTSGSVAKGDHCCLILRSVVGVMGNLILAAVGMCLEYARWMPACISRSLGREENSLGSGRPRLICM